MAQTADGVGEVEEHGLTGLVDSESCVATLLGSTGCDVAGNEVTEGGITALEIVIAVLVRNLGGLDLMLAQLLHVLKLLGNPDTAVVTQTLAHKRQLALLLAVDGNTGRMDLREAGICEICTLAVALHSSGTVAVHSVGGEEIGISITAGGNHHGVCAEPFELAGDQVAGDDTLSLAVDDDEVEHLVTRIALYGTCGNLLVEGCIGTQKELLSGLTAGIEGTADLHATEGTVGKVSAVFTGERNTLGHALVDDGCTYLCQTIDIGLAGTIVTTFDGIVEEPVHRVIVVLVVLGSIDTTLGRDGVGPAGRIADAENLHIIAEFAEARSCGCAAEAGTDHYDFEFALVVRTDKMNFRLTLFPFLGQRTIGNL